MGWDRDGLIEKDKVAYTSKAKRIHSLPLLAGSCAVISRKASSISATWEDKHRNC